MSVHYKFKSAVSFDTICFDGLHISVGELKKAIKHQKKIGKSTDYDLQITDAQTKQVYVSEEDLIPKNTSVIVARIPLAQPLKKTRKIQESQQTKMFSQSERSDLPQYNHDIDSPPHLMYDPLSKTADLANANASESDKIKAMFGQSGHEYEVGRLKTKSMVGPLPPNYSCFRCNQPGHWIKDCPTNNIDIKRSTGIPRSFMVPVDGPTAKGALLTSSGEYAVPLIDHLAYQEVKKEKPFYKEQELVVKPRPEIPLEIQCYICKDPMKDAVYTPCCAENFCDECIRQVLLESESMQCYKCGKTEISPSSLIPCRYLRNQVQKYLDQENKHYTPPTPMDTAIKQVKTEPAQDKSSPLRNTEDFISEELKEPGTPLADEPCDEASNHSGDKMAKSNEEEHNSISTILTRTNLSSSYGKNSEKESYSDKYYERSSSSRHYDSHYNSKRRSPRRYSRRSPDHHYRSEHRGRRDDYHSSRDRSYEARSSSAYKSSSVFPQHQDFRFPEVSLYEAPPTVPPPAYPHPLIIPCGFPPQPPPPGETLISQPPPPGVPLPPQLTLPHLFLTQPPTRDPPPQPYRPIKNIEEFLLKPVKSFRSSRRSSSRDRRYRPRSKSFSKSRSRSYSRSPSPHHRRRRSRSYHRYSRSHSRSPPRYHGSPPYSPSRSDYRRSYYEDYKSRPSRYESSSKRGEAFSKSDNSYKIKSHTTSDKLHQKREYIRRDMPSSVIQLVRDSKMESPRRDDPLMDKTIIRRVIQNDTKPEKITVKRIELEEDTRQTMSPPPQDKEIGPTTPPPAVHKEKKHHKHKRKDAEGVKKKKRKLTADEVNSENSQPSDAKPEKVKKHKNKSRTNSCQTHKKVKLGSESEKEKEADPQEEEPQPKEANHEEEPSPPPAPSKEEEGDSLIVEPAEELELEPPDKSPTPTQDDGLHIEMPELSRWERDDFEIEEDSHSKSLEKTEGSKSKGGLSSEIIKRAEKAILQKPLKAARASPPYKPSEIKPKEESKEKYNSSGLQVTISSTKEYRSVQPKTVVIDRHFDKRPEERKVDKKSSNTTVTRHVKLEPLNRDVERVKRRSRTPDKIKDRHSSKDKHVSRERPSSRERDIERPVSHERHVIRDKHSSKDRRTSKDRHCSFERRNSRERQSEYKNRGSTEKRRNQVDQSREERSRESRRQTNSTKEEPRAKRTLSRSPSQSKPRKQFKKDYSASPHHHTESSSDVPKDRAEEKRRAKIERRLSTFNEAKFEPNYDATSESESEEEGTSRGRSPADNSSSSSSSPSSSPPSNRVNPDDLRHKLNKKYKHKKQKKHKHKKKKSHKKHER